MRTTISPTPLFLLLALALTTLAIASTAHADGGPDHWLTGDADCSGHIDSVDAALALQWDAGLLPSLPCWSAADANDDLAVDSLDALLMLQQNAALVDRLGVPETLLCPAPVGKGHYGNIDEPIDLTGDGTPEVVTVHPFVEPDVTKLGVAAYTTDGHLQVIEEIVVSTPAGGDPNGPDTWWAHTDLTGDGVDDAVLCVTTFDANGPITSAVVYSFDGGILSAKVLSQLPHAQLSREGDSFVAGSRLDWLAGACAEATTDRYGWDGTQLAVISHVVTARFRQPNCAGLRPPS